MYNARRSSAATQHGRFFYSDTGRGTRTTSTTTTTAERTPSASTGLTLSTMSVGVNKSLWVSDGNGNCSNSVIPSYSQNIPNILNHDVQCGLSTMAPSLVAVANLIDLSNDLFCRGGQEDALSLYASALSVCRNPFSQPQQQLAQQVLFGVEKLRCMTQQAQSLLATQSDLPDTYHEDECDVGPRPFRLALFPDISLLSSLFKCSNDATTTSTTVENQLAQLVLFYAEILMMYNKALIHQARSEYGPAMKLYETVAVGLTKLLPEPDRPSLPLLCTAAPATTLYHKLLELYMRCNTNMGQIDYILGLEEAAMSHFEAALLYANRRLLTSGDATVATSNNVNIKNNAATVLLGVASTPSNLTTNLLRLDYATVVSNWCRAHWMSGDINDQIYEGLKEVLHIRSSILAWNHMDVASAHYNLGVAEYARNNTEAALSHLFGYLQVAAQDAKDARDDATATASASGSSSQSQKKKQPLDPIPALVYILLIKNEHKTDEISQELVRGLRSLQEKRADVGPQGSEVASVLNFIGTLLFHQADYEHALLFFQEELRLEENLVFHNKDDVSISVTCNNIGRILQELNRLPEAKHFYHRALKTSYGDDIEAWCAAPTRPGSCPLRWNEENLDSLPHSTMQLYSAVWYNLGLIHDKLGCYLQATNAFHVSLGLRRAMLGPNHADVACLLYNIGVLQMEQSMLSEATSSFREALRIRHVSPESTGHLNDKHVTQTLKKLASLHKSKGDISGALETLFEILNIQQISMAATDGEAPADESSVDASMTDMAKTKDMGITVRDIAELYHAEGKLSQAVQMAQQSVQLLRQIQQAPVEGQQADFVTRTEELVAGLLLLGSLYHEVCEPTQARIFFQEAAVKIRQVFLYFPASKELAAMHEVTQILAACHCAPLA